jgi:hypothetical protein
MSQQMTPRNPGTMDLLIENPPNRRFYLNCSYKRELSRLQAFSYHALRVSLAGAQYRTQPKDRFNRSNVFRGGALKRILFSTRQL